MAKGSSVSKLALAQDHLRELQNEIAVLPEPPQGLAAKLKVLRDQLGELEVAHEELEQQNDELVATARRWSSNATATSASSTTPPSAIW